MGGAGESPKELNFSILHKCTPCPLHLHFLQPWKSSQPERLQPAGVQSISGGPSEVHQGLLREIIFHRWYGPVHTAVPRYVVGGPCNQVQATTRAYPLQATWSGFGLAAGPTTREAWTPRPEFPSRSMGSRRGVHCNRCMSVGICRHRFCQPQAGSMVCSPPHYLQPPPLSGQGGRVQAQYDLGGSCDTGCHPVMVARHLCPGTCVVRFTLRTSQHGQAVQQVTGSQPHRT